ncbi:MAG: hypothetical protein KUG74_13855 [Rhodobacteraceae bacterium]|nr:hypothetical protein [Paracoccaceae bacterium]
MEEWLLAAHEVGNLAALVGLHRQAGEQLLAGGYLDAGCFFLTQAYVFALDCGDARAADIHRVLVGYGREAN